MTRRPRTVRRGSYLVSPHSVPAFRPLRVTERLGKCARIFSLGDSWVKVDEYELAPAGYRWHAGAERWLARKTEGPRRERLIWEPGGENLLLESGRKFVAQVSGIGAHAAGVMTWGGA